MGEDTAREAGWWECEKDCPRSKDVGQWVGAFSQVLFAPPSLSIRQYEYDTNIVGVACLHAYCNVSGVIVLNLNQLVSVVESGWNVVHSDTIGMAERLRQRHTRRRAFAQANSGRDA